MQTDGAESTVERTQILRSSEDAKQSEGGSAACHESNVVSDCPNVYQSGRGLDVKLKRLDRDPAYINVTVEDC